MDAGRGGRARRGRARPAGRRRRTASTSRAARCCRPSATATCTRCGEGSSWPGRRSATPPGSPRSSKPYGVWAVAHPHVDLGAGRSLRPDPGARRPVRRGLAGCRRRGPAGGPPVDRPPLRLGELRGAAPRRHRRRHPRPADRQVARRPDGTVLGTLVEWTAMELVLRHAPRATSSRRLEGLAGPRHCWRGRADLGAGGCTRARRRRGVPGAAADRPAGGARQHRAAGRPDSWRAQRAEFLAVRRAAAASPVAGQVSARTVKMFADGVVEAGTASMLEPYDGRAALLRPGPVLVAATSSPPRRQPSTLTVSSCTFTPSATPRCAQPGRPGAAGRGQRSA